jgi:type IV pilus assembly protein PilO
MAKASLPRINIDIEELKRSLQSQFSGLNPNDPSQWPTLPKALAFAGIGLGVLTLLWYLLINPLKEELEVERQQEVALRQTYTDKLSQAINLEELKKQLDQVKQYVTQLEKQLPSKAEMDALLSDINQAGLGRSLQFELFRPGQVAVKDYYAELPISIRITGGYHDVGMFASDIAHLSRIVTLNDISLLPASSKDGALVMEGIAKTYRYLDPEEVLAQQKAAAAKVTPK